jgi:hypothetical protein
MAIFEKRRLPGEDTEYFVIMAAGNQLREWVSWPDKPTEAMLRDLLCPRIDGDLTHVAVLHQGQMCSLFLDFVAQAKGKLRNRVATEVIYGQYCKRNPTATLESLDPWVHGDAVLFGRVIYRGSRVPPALTNVRRN